MKCKCKYYQMNKEGIRVCSVCGKPSPTQPQIEDKMVGRQNKKAPLYVSDKDKKEVVRRQFRQYRETIAELK